ncbi:MAG: YfbK domain-containing protein, partial [Bernardetiaceae bacterium]
NDQDFNDDAKDAGELGAGHNVTALYEIIPLGVTSSYLPKTDSLKYQRREVRPSPEWLTLKLRYKLPDEETSRLITRTVSEENITKSLPFAAAVSAFGMILQNSSYKGSATYTKVKELALSSSLRDGDPYKRDFLRLVKMAELISDKQ